ncbi:hypothetical protein LCGC14_2905110 [marine sediment metagenome]|uniref:Uncharacterized protein n=1 Tax=marine sediment metagenome TaxID=412755 RepID=A0A0F8YF44_9ZZZZ
MSNKAKAYYIGAATSILLGFFLIWIARDWSMLAGGSVLLWMGTAEQHS